MNLERLLDVCKKLIPTPFIPLARRCWIILFHHENYIKTREKTREIQQYYKSIQCNVEIEEVLSGIKTYGLRAFPYSWAEQPKKNTNRSIS